MSSEFLHAGENVLIIDDFRHDGGDRVQAQERRRADVDHRQGPAHTKGNDDALCVTFEQQRIAQENTAL